MRILVSGASGFVGAPLCQHLIEQGHHVVPLVRKPRGGGIEVVWDPDQGRAAKEPFEGFDAVIHLAGEPLKLCRWTEKRKEQILFSRSVGTFLLSHILASLRHPPKVFITASAVGYYGDRGEEWLEEGDSPGDRFLARVCVEWEKASEAIERRGTRVVRTRFGIVLGPDGGVISKMAPAFKLGLGAVLGTGKQWVSWIARDDLIRGMDHVLNSELEGSVNFVSPEPVRQEDFAKELAGVLNRPLFLRAPASLLRMIFGPAADTLLFFSARVRPRLLLESGFTYKYPGLKEALSHSLRR